MHPVHLARLAAALSATPAMGTAEYSKWVRQQDFLNFMAANAQDKDHVVLDASGRHLLIQSALVPEKALAKGDVADLLSWSGFSPTWGITSTFRNRRPQAWLSPPDFDTKLLSQGEPLLFHRSFDGRDGDKSYVELNPRLAHPHDLHFVESRRAFCRFDDVGDVEDIVSIVHEEGDEGSEQTRVITIRRDVLDLHLAVTKTALVRMFDSTRFCIGAFNGWGEIDETIVHDEASGLHFRGHYEDSHASYLRGIQLVRGPEKPAELLRRFIMGERETRRYETFITLDWRNDRVAEVSCDPSALGNYFETSDRPYEISPVFFKPDVLLKYKADPEKYEVEERQVLCPNGWSLQTYDINELGQVHTYIKYLGQLPHAEHASLEAIQRGAKRSHIQARLCQRHQRRLRYFLQPSPQPEGPLGRTGQGKGPMVGSAVTWVDEACDLHCHRPSGRVGQ